jgi:hypothetical protein
MGGDSGDAKPVSIDKTQLALYTERRNLKMQSKQRDPEDEAFEELARSQLWRKRQISAANGPEEAFLAWAGHSHHPQQFDVERRAFMAGWRAAMEQQ